MNGVLLEWEQGWDWGVMAFGIAPLGKKLSFIVWAAACSRRSRELLRHLKGAELKVWIYLLTRGGPQSICYPTYEDIVTAQSFIMRPLGCDSD